MSVTHLPGNGPITYLAGPMRNIQQFNFPAFHAAADHLQRGGFPFISPADHDLIGGFDPIDMTGNEDLAVLGFDLRATLAWDMEQIALHAGAVCVLPGWERSSGARAEVALAHALGLPVAPVEAFGEHGGIDQALCIQSPAPASGTIASVLRPAPRLIGIGGHLAAGKDEVADRLVAEHGFVKMGMSDPLHQAMLAVNPWLPLEGGPAGLGRQKEFTTYAYHVNDVGYTEAKRNPEVRRLLQKLGTEVGRKMIDEDVWVEIAGRQINALLKQGAKVVITGIRFPNELQMISERGGTTVWVDRPSKIVHPDAAGHASEVSLGGDDFDVWLMNTGTLDHLAEITDYLITEPAPRKIA